MKIIVTGATGVIGRNAIPELVENGHEVVGFHRRDDGATWLRSVAARPRRVDLFDPDDLQRELRGADVVIHLATSIPPLAKMTKARHWDDNDRLAPTLRGTSSTQPGEPASHGSSSSRSAPTTSIAVITGSPRTTTFAQSSVRRRVPSSPRIWSPGSPAPGRPGSRYGLLSSTDPARRRQSS
jgi:uncharacterized protein YbjT (DUF2867 family)